MGHMLSLPLSLYLSISLYIYIYMYISFSPYPSPSLSLSLYLYLSLSLTRTHPLLMGTSSDARGPRRQLAALGQAGRSASSHACGISERQSRAGCTAGASRRDASVPHEAVTVPGEQLVQALRELLAQA